MIFVLSEPPDNGKGMRESYESGAFNQEVAHPRMKCARIHVQKTRIVLLRKILYAFHL